MEHQKQQASVWRDLVEPGWREREAERVQKFLDAIPVREPLARIGQRKEPCGECRLQPGERCNVCGASDVR
jgi:hypothetical protein